MLVNVLGVKQELIRCRAGLRFTNTASLSLIKSNVNTTRVHVFHSLTNQSGIDQYVHADCTDTLFL